MEENQDEEAFFNEFYDKLEEIAPSTEALMHEEERRKFAHWVWDKVAQAYANGYNQGVSDVEEAHRRMDE